MCLLLNPWSVITGLGPSRSRESEAPPALACTLQQAEGNGQVPMPATGYIRVHLPSLTVLARTDSDAPTACTAMNDTRLVTRREQLTAACSVHDTGPLHW